MAVRRTERGSWDGDRLHRRGAPRGRQAGPRTRLPDRGRHAQSDRNAAEIFQQRQCLWWPEVIEGQPNVSQEAIEVQKIVGVRGQRIGRAISRVKVPEKFSNFRDRVLLVIQKLKGDAPVLPPPSDPHVPLSVERMFDTAYHGPLPKTST